MSPVASQGEPAAVSVRLPVTVDGSTLSPVDVKTACTVTFSDPSSTRVRTGDVLVLVVFDAWAIEA